MDWPQTPSFECVCPPAKIHSVYHSRNSLATQRAAWAGPGLGRNMNDTLCVNAGWVHSSVTGSQALWQHARGAAESLAPVPHGPNLKDQSRALNPGPGVTGDWNGSRPKACRLVLSAKWNVDIWNRLRKCSSCTLERWRAWGALFSVPTVTSEDLKSISSWNRVAAICYWSILKLFPIPPLPSRNAAALRNAARRAPAHQLRKLSKSSLSTMIIELDLLISKAGSAYSAYFIYIPRFCVFCVFFCVFCIFLHWQKYKYYWGRGNCVSFAYSAYFCAYFCVYLFACFFWRIFLRILRILHILLRILRVVSVCFCVLCAYLFAYSAYFAYY